MSSKKMTQPVVMGIHSAAACAPRVSVIIPTYAGSRHLNTCLAALLEQTRPADEILVIDDASPPPTDAEFLSREFPDQPTLRILSNSANLGFAAKLWAAADALRRLSHDPAACATLSRAALRYAETVGNADVAATRWLTWLHG